MSKTKKTIRPPAKKPINAGRRKGIPNRDTVLLQEKASEIGVNPFEILLLFAKGDYKALGYKQEFITKIAQGIPFKEYTIDPKTRAMCAEKACHYLYPKRKSIEIKQDEDSVLTLELRHGKRFDKNE